MRVPWGVFLAEGAKMENLCCYLSKTGEACRRTAEWEIQWNLDPHDATQACESHVGALLGPRAGEPEPDSYRVYRVK